MSVRMLPAVSVVPNICRAVSGSLWDSSMIYTALSCRMGFFFWLRWMRSASRRLWLQIWMIYCPSQQASRKQWYRQSSSLHLHWRGTQMRSRS